MSDLNAQNSADALFAAIQAGESDEVDRLLGEDPQLATATNEHGIPALMWALYHRQQSIAEAIHATRLKAGSHLDLHEAAAIGDYDRVREHLAFGNELSGFSNDGFTPLHFAAFFGRESLVPLFVDSGAAVAVAARNPSGVHPLHSAAAIGSVRICQILLKRGAKVDAQQHGGFTAMMSAAMHGNLALVELLLEHGADLSIESEEGKTAADMAEDGGHDRVVTRLQEAS